MDMPVEGQHHRGSDVSGQLLSSLAATVSGLRGSTWFIASTVEPINFRYPLLDNHSSVVLVFRIASMEVLLTTTRARDSGRTASITLELSSLTQSTNTSE